MTVLYKPEVAAVTAARVEAVGEEEFFIKAFKNGFTSEKKVVGVAVTGR
jgi:hypothetical protein